jgi:cytochrome c-type biogenesis protein CcmE
MMNLVQRQRLQLIILVTVLLSAGFGLTLYALRQNINLFYTPTDVMRGTLPLQHRIRVGGLVEKNSVKRDGLMVRFSITDNRESMVVHYQGVLPDLFREGQGIVAEGQLRAQGRFVAERVLAKHDENYMPPEVAATLQQAESHVT